MPKEKLIIRFSKQIESLENQILGIEEKVKRASKDFLRDRHQQNLDDAKQKLFIAKDALVKAKNMEDFVSEPKKLIKSIPFSQEALDKKLVDFVHKNKNIREKKIYKENRK